jgi:hypothetical protein
VVFIASGRDMRHKKSASQTSA